MTHRIGPPTIPPDKVIVSLYDFSGVMARPWYAAGYSVEMVDVRHPAGRLTLDNQLVTCGTDVRNYTPPHNVGLIIAQPPCTHLAASGARWWEGKGLGKLAEGLELVHAAVAMADDYGVPFVLENPVGRLSTAWRPPDWTFNPCEYAGYAYDSAAEAYTKRTCIWTWPTIGKPPTLPVAPVLGSMMHRMAPSPDRAARRSVAPMGFARALFCYLSHPDML